MSVTTDKHKLICWIAEYSYCKANGYPMGEGHTPPSIVYMQVEKDFDKYLGQSNTSKNESGEK